MKITGLRPLRRELLDLLLVVLTAAAVALGLHVFVYRANFAPSGVDGIATMLQYLSERTFGYRINAGIFSFAINLPLLVAAWFVLRRRYVVYTLLYTVICSLVLLALDAIDFYQYDVLTPGSENSPLIAALFGGVTQGVLGMMHRLGGSSGGVDVIGCMIQRRLPHRDVEKVISWLSYLVVAIAFFVYRDLNSVCLSVISIFVCERVSTVFLRTRRNAVKFEIVTDADGAAVLRHVILHELCHGATLLRGEGMYSGEGKTVILCLVSYRELPAFLKLTRSLPNTFLYYSDVMGVRGNFDYTPTPNGTESLPPHKER